MQKASNIGTESLRDIFNASSYSPKSFEERGNVRLDSRGNSIPPDSQLSPSETEDTEEIV